MCYYNGQRVTREEFIRLKDLEKAVKKYDFLNAGVISGFSDIPVAVVVPTADKGDFDIVQMDWGFLPPYLKNDDDAKRFQTGYKDAQGKWHTGYTTQNSKAENLFINEAGTRASIFADAARNRRCLVLSTGFYEWRHFYRLNKKTGQPLKTADKYPYFIHLREHEYFFMAGIWQNWVNQETGEIKPTVAIVTTAANALMKQVHNSKERMPAILSDELAWRWLTEDLSDEQVTEIALTQYDTREMEACTIAKDFQTSLEPSAPFAYADLPALELAISV